MTLKSGVTGVSSTPVEIGSAPKVNITLRKNNPDEDNWPFLMCERIAMCLHKETEELIYLELAATES